MCLLTYFPPGIQPDCQALRNGTVTNDDGHGFAIVAGDRLIVRRSMVAETLIGTFAELRRKHPSGPALFHSRWGTGGAYTTFNCHPFYLGDDKQTVIAHNGIFGQVPVPKTEKRCDTRIVAEEILPTQFAGGRTAADRQALAAWMGLYNKVAILTINPAYGQPAFLLNEKRGFWEEGGMWYSNFDYLTEKDQWAAYLATDPPGNGYATCPYCRQRDAVDPEMGVCLFCDTCLDCGQHWRTGCLCYLPEELRTAEDEEARIARADWADIIEKYSHVTD